MRKLSPLRRAALPRMFEAPDVERSTAPTEIEGQEVMVHKRANLFPRGRRYTA